MLRSLVIKKISFVLENTLLHTVQIQQAEMQWMLSLMTCLRIVYKIQDGCVMGQFEHLSEQQVLLN